MHLLLAFAANGWAMDDGRAKAKINKGVWPSVKRVLIDALGHFNDDDGWSMASHVALSVLMALFPFLIFIAEVAGMMDTGDLVSGVVALMFEAWPHEVADPLAKEVTTVLTGWRGDVVISTILLTLYLASNGVEALRSALNRAYRITDQRSFLWRRSQAILFVLVGALGFLALAFLVVLWPLIWINLVRYLPALAAVQPTFDLLRFGIASAVLIVGLFISHVWLAAGHRGLADVWPGIVVTLALWLIGAIAYGAYLEGFANYVSTYAGLAGVMTALFFLYLVAVVFILGGELNAAIHRERFGQ